MKAYAPLVLLVAMCLAALAEDKSFGNVNVKEYKDRARLKAFIDCLKGKGECTTEEANIRERGKQIVASKCSSCSDKEKQVTRDLTSLIAAEYPDELPTLFGVYDPTSANTRDHLNTLNTFSSQADIPDIPIETIEKL